MKKALSVYIHIPFCLRKCLYCDFLSAPAGEQERDAYVRALCGEIRAEAEHYKEYMVTTVFLGGGTPSLLSGKQLARIFDVLREHYAFSGKPEITVEMNPGTITEEKLLHYAKSGVNRVSIGLQSADNTELARLGRIHTWEEFLAGYELCREVGFRNINVDLMSALPGQTFASYLETLRKVTALRPEHISAYSLIIEEGTPFYEMYAEEGEAALPDEETERAMYEETKRLLGDCGYRRYEISNYALPGYECAHNCVYWQRGDYVGFGLGAASMTGGRRWSNVRSLSDYMELPDGAKKTAFCTLSEDDQMEETMFLGLRMMRGVSEASFSYAFHRPLDAVYGKVIEKHCAQGLLTRENGAVRLTDRGIDVSNYVLADFLLGE
ncbi:MAG: oxygen-independent coproporphyrinogen III oxidase [Lachnospiraceae bacterium]|nr:oxygen-independent coproporphyrinogen III oxidase [Lachnospiraceae bacterium]